MDELTVVLPDEYTIRKTDCPPLPRVVKVRVLTMEETIKRVTEYVARRKREDADRT